MPIRLGLMPQALGLAADGLDGAWGPSGPAAGASSPASGPAGGIDTSKRRPVTPRVQPARQPPRLRGSPADVVGRARGRSPRTVPCRAPSPADDTVSVRPGHVVMPPRFGGGGGPPWSLLRSVTFSGHLHLLRAVASHTSSRSGPVGRRRAHETKPGRTRPAVRGASEWTRPPEDMFPCRSHQALSLFLAAPPHYTSPRALWFRHGASDVAY